jgi:hypothetical protein
MLRMSVVRAAIRPRLTKCLSQSYLLYTSQCPQCAPRRAFCDLASPTNPLSGLCFYNCIPGQFGLQVLQQVQIRRRRRRYPHRPQDSRQWIMWPRARKSYATQNHHSWSGRSGSKIRRSLVKTAASTPEVGSRGEMTSLTMTST